MNASHTDSRSNVRQVGDCTSSRVQRAVAWSLSLGITATVLTSMATLAGGYQADAQLAAQRTDPASHQARWVGDQRGLASGSQNL